MPFFNINGSGTNSKKLKRIETAIWVLIYGGLLTFIIGHFTTEANVTTARLMGIVGMVLVAVGVALIYVRSRLREEDKPTGDKP